MHLQNSEAAALDLFEYIEGWYNPHRRHSGLGQKSPRNFEAMHTDPKTKLSTQQG